MGRPHEFLDQVSVVATHLGDVEEGLFFIKVQGGLTPTWKRIPEPVVCCKATGDSADYYEVDLPTLGNRGGVQHGHPEDHVMVLPYPPRHH